MARERGGKLHGSRVPHIVVVEMYDGESAHRVLNEASAHTPDGIWRAVGALERERDEARVTSEHGGERRQSLPEAGVALCLEREDRIIVPHRKRERRHCLGRPIADVGLHPQSPPTEDEEGGCESGLLAGEHVLRLLDAGSVSCAQEDERSRAHDEREGRGAGRGVIPGGGGGRVELGSGAFGASGDLA